MFTDIKKALIMRISKTNMHNLVVKRHKIAKIYPRVYFITVTLTIKNCVEDNCLGKPFGGNCLGAIILG